MNYEWLRNFLSSPELPDIVSYIFVLITLIAQVFVKKFVKKDNFFTAEKVNAKVDKVDKLYAKLQESDKSHEKDRKKWEEERKELKDEIEVLKRAIRLNSVNTKELVKSGIANEIAKLLPISEENNELSEIKIEKQNCVETIKSDAEDVNNE